MTTTAWRFPGTESADAAVVKLRQLHDQDLIEVQDVAVLRWPPYASEPTVHEHVTDEGSKLTSLMSKIKHGAIDGSMIASAKADMRPGDSALVLLSANAAVDAVASAFGADQMELIRTDMSVPEQDQLRAAMENAARQQQGRPPA
jgi:uncharacterized membrane protein